MRGDDEHDPFVNPWWPRLGVAIVLVSAASVIALILWVAP